MDMRILIIPLGVGEPTKTIEEQPNSSEGLVQAQPLTELLLALVFNGRNSFAFHTSTHHASL